MDNVTELVRNYSPVNNVGESLGRHYTMTVVCISSAADKVGSSHIIYIWVPLVLPLQSSQ